MNKVGGVSVTISPDDLVHCTNIDEEPKFLRIVAEAEIFCPLGKGDSVVQTIYSPSLSGIAGDTDRDSLQGIAREELDLLREILEGMNVDVSDWSRRTQCLHLIGD